MRKCWCEYRKPWVGRVLCTRWTWRLSPAWAWSGWTSRRGGWRLLSLPYSNRSGRMLGICIHPRIKYILFSKVVLFSCLSKFLHNGQWKQIVPKYDAVDQYIILPLLKVLANQRTLIDGNYRTCYLIGEKSTELRVIWTNAHRVDYFFLHLTRHTWPNPSM